jgi:hypothetical protein
MPRGVKSPFSLPAHLRLPNEQSPWQTPATLQIDLHYCRLRVWERWTYERFVRLAKFLNVTPVELASAACIPHRAIATLKERNHLYLGRVPDRAGALVLTLLEAHVAKHFTTDVIENPFPNLNSSDSAKETSHARPEDS